MTLEYLPAALSDAQINDPPTGHLDRLRRVLAAQGWRLHKTEWKGWRAQYKIECTHGHVFSRTSNLILHRGVACLACRRTALLTEAAEQHGGRHLPDPTLPKLHARFICAQGHEFVASLRRAKEGWCYVCARQQNRENRRNPAGLKRLQQAAVARGGVCLTAQYASSASYCRFRCKEGHEWDAQANEVLRGRWCRRCANEKKRVDYRMTDGLARLQAHAAERGGVCLSDAYAGGRARYRFRCAAGHEWETNGKAALRGAWCWECGHVGRRIGLAALQTLAAARGGRCLSTEYANNSTKMEWECHRGHRWHARCASVMKGSWCPSCAILARIKKPGSRARFKYVAEES